MIVTKHKNFSQGRKQAYIVDEKSIFGTGDLRPLLMERIDLSPRVCQLGLGTLRALFPQVVLSKQQLRRVFEKLKQTFIQKGHQFIQNSKKKKIKFKLN